MVAAWACVVAPCAARQAAATPEVLWSAAWDSAYVSEGRDNLGEGGMFSGAIQSTWHGVGFSGWAAHGDSVDYREYNLGVGYAFSLGSVHATVGYTHLEFDGAGESPGDNEFALGISLPVPGEIEIAMGGRYSTQAEGAFFEVIARRPCKLGTTRIVLTPYAVFGVDHGYASVEHDGPNHFEGGLTLEHPIGEAMLSLYCAHCWAQRDVHLDGGGDLSWGGVSVAMSF